MRTDSSTAENGRSTRSVGQLVRDVVSDARDLVQEELLLARIEAGRTVQSRAIGAVALAVAGGAALLGVVFGGLAAAAGLALVLPMWLASLIVMGAFFALAGLAALVGRLRMKRPAPLEETRRTVKEDVQWAKARLTS